MGFRIVVVNSRCKLETRLNYLVVRGESEKKIYIHEINTLIVQSTAVSLTAALLSVLIENRVKVIFCDEKCSPQAELMPYRGAHNTVKRYKWQFSWKDETKDEIWQTIVRKKIGSQADLLERLGFQNETQMLRRYREEVQKGDASNREGHAAKVYFHCILPEGTSRRNGGFINACLNYGYAVLLSAFNREIAAAGLLTQLGIRHDNEFNAFNLSCDLIEPFRAVVDETALSLCEEDGDFKRKMANILNYGVVMEGKKTTLDLAIRSHVRSVMYALEEGDVSLVSYPEKIMFEDEL